MEMNVSQMSYCSEEMAKTSLPFYAFVNNDKYDNKHWHNTDHNSYGDLNTF